MMIMRILLSITVLGFSSCNSFNSHHHIILEHNISIRIEEEVHKFLQNLYEEEPLNQ